MLKKAILIAFLLLIALGSTSLASSCKLEITEIEYPDKIYQGEMFILKGYLTVLETIKHNDWRMKAEIAGGPKKFYTEVVWGPRSHNKVSDKFSVACNLIFPLMLNLENTTWCWIYIAMKVSTGSLRIM